MASSKQVNGENSWSLGGWALQTWPHSSEYMGNTNCSLQVNAHLEFLPAFLNDVLQSEGKNHPFFPKLLLVMALYDRNTNPL